MAAYSRSFGAWTEREILSGDTDGVLGNGGFVVDADGTLHLRLRHESSLSPMAVLKGHFYNMDVAEVDLTSSTGVTEVQVFRRQA